jgi:hypothetical protein
MVFHDFNFNFQILPKKTSSMIGFLCCFQQKGVNLSFESHELKLELLVLILQIRDSHNVGLY